MLIDKDFIDEIAPYQFKSEHELLDEINRLIYQFNLERDKLNDAYRDKKAIAAYLYYFFATNVPKLDACLSLLDRNVVDKLQSFQLVDFGAGPGTLSFSWLEKFPEFDNDITLVERNQDMQAVSMNLFRNEKQVSFSRKVPQFPNTCLCFSHSFNELTFEEFKSVLNEANPKAVMFIEPGTKECFAKMKLARNELLEQGFQIEFPCPTSKECPLSTEDWCHQYLHLKHDASIERLTQRLKRNRRVVPIIFHLYMKDKVEHNGQAVILGKYKPLKFGYEFDVCLDNQKVKIQIQKKTLTKAQEKLVKEFSAGTRIAFNIVKELGSDYFRVELK